MGRALEENQHLLGKLRVFTTEIDGNGPGDLIPKGGLVRPDGFGDFGRIATVFPRS